MAVLESITDLIFNVSFTYYDANYLTKRTTKPSYSGSTPCTLKDGNYIISKVFPYSDPIYHSHYYLPYDHGMKFECDTDLKMTSRYVSKVSVAESLFIDPGVIKKFIKGSMKPETEEGIIETRGIATFRSDETFIDIAIRLHYSKLRTVIREIKFIIPKDIGDDWFVNFMKQRNQMV